MVRSFDFDVDLDTGLPVKASHIMNEYPSIFGFVMNFAYVCWALGQ
jgi:hypothetical protein